MRALRLFMLLLLATPAVSSAQMPGVPPLDPVDPSLPTPAAGTGICTIRGQLLSPADFGLPPGEVVADATALLLADGRVRLYMFAQGLGVVSAVSVAADGLAFVPEEGVRLPDGSGMPRVVALPDGRVRLFYTSGGGIKSAISADGLAFAPEDGFRLTAREAGFGESFTAATTGPTVVRLPDGRYRMYFSDLPRPGDPPGNHRVKSAISSDMLTWRVENGVVLGPGAHPLAGSAEHPFALQNTDGSVTLYYGKYGETGAGQPEGLYQTTADDGVTFAEETLAVAFGNDPDAVRLADGTLALYYGQFDPERGGTINVAACPEPRTAAQAVQRRR